MTRVVLIAIYLIGMVVAVVSLDASGGGELPIVWLIASVLLGAGTGDFRLALLSLLAIPLAIPFGLPAERDSDPVFPVWVGALYVTPFSAFSILLGALGRETVESRLRRRRSSRGSGIA